MHEMEVLLIRQLLEQLLDYHYDVYLGKLRDWFAGKISKEQFDNDLSSVLQGEILQLHNQLLLAILAQSSSLGDQPGHQNRTTDTSRREDVEDLGPLRLDQLKSQDASAVPFNVYKVDHRRVLNVHVDTSRRFPAKFAKEFQVAHRGDYNFEVNVIPNVTHGIIPNDENLELHPTYLEIFKIRDKNQPLLTSEANLYGRFLVEAWKRQLDTVKPEAINCAVQACIHHLKKVIIAIAKQRKSFRVREGRYIHSIGAPYPNPYLRQGHHIFEESYSSDTAKLADVMQIPSFLPTHEERERLAALEVASSVPLRYPALQTKATLTDLHDALKIDRTLVPSYAHRTKMLEIIFQKAKGYGDTYSNDQDNDISQDLVPKTVFPIISY